MKEGALCALVLFSLGVLFVGQGLRHEVFLSTEVVYRSTPPWNDQDLGSLETHNPFLSDHSTIYLPSLVRLREQVHRGSLPLRNPSVYAGAPFLGNYSSAIFSPYSWGYVFLPLADSFAWIAILKWVVAGLGAFACARLFQLRKLPAFLTAISFGYCGYNVFWINSTLTHVSSLAPWALFASERVVRRPSPRSVAVLAFTCGLVWCGGHPETSFFVQAGLCLYGAIRSQASTSSLRILLAGFLAHLIGLGLASIQVLPFLEYALVSEGHRTRSAPLTGPLIETFEPKGLLLLLVLTLMVLISRVKKKPLAFNLLTALLVGSSARLMGVDTTFLMGIFPDIFGSPLDGGTYFGPYTYSDMGGGYCGSLILCLALISFLRPTSSPTWRGLKAVFVIMGMVSFRFPMVSDLIDALPLVDKMHRTRAFALWVLSATLLAGRAVQALGEGRVSLRRELGIVLAFFFSFAVPWLDILPIEAQRWSPSGQRAEDYHTEIYGQTSHDVPWVEVNLGHRTLGRVPVDSNHYLASLVGASKLPEGQYAVEATHPSDPQRLDQRSFVVQRPYRWAWTHAWFFAAILLILTMAKLSSRWKVWLIPLLGVAELLSICQPYNGTTPRDQLPRPTKAIEFLQNRRKEDGPFRVLGARTTIQPNLHDLFGLETLRGYDALEPSRYAALIRSMFEGNRPLSQFEQDFSTMHLESPIADILNLRYVLSHETVPDEGWTEVLRDGDLILYENIDVHPRAFTVQESLSPAMALELPPEELRRVAVLEDRPQQKFEGSSRILEAEFGDNQHQLLVVCDQGAVLILSELALPGWKALVDGEEHEVTLSHGALISLTLGPGLHCVHLKYSPTSFRSGLGLTILCLLLGLGLLGPWDLARRRRLR